MSTPVGTYQYTVRITRDLLLYVNDGLVADAPGMGGDEQLAWALERISDVQSTSLAPLQLTIQDHRADGYGTHTVTLAASQRITFGAFRDYALSIAPRRVFEALHPVDPHEHHQDGEEWPFSADLPSGRHSAAEASPASAPTPARPPEHDEPETADPDLTAEPDVDQEPPAQSAPPAPTPTQVSLGDEELQTDPPHGAAADDPEPDAVEQPESSTVGPPAAKVRTWASEERVPYERSRPVLPVEQAAEVKDPGPRRRRRMWVAVGLAVAVLIAGVAIVWRQSISDVYVATCIDERTMTRQMVDTACESPNQSYYRWWYTPKGSTVAAVGQDVDVSQGSTIKPREGASISTGFAEDGGTVGG